MKSVERFFAIVLAAFACVFGCAAESGKNENEAMKNESITSGKSYFRGFLVDNVLHSKNEGDIHFSLYVPKTYDGSENYALFVTLPGWEGLYFQGVAENLRQEDFGPDAIKYNSKMIVAAPQLSDWGMKSARQTVALVEYLLNAYKIDSEKVYINGYSGGGETLSLVMQLRPELFTAALFVSSKWDGDLEKLAAARTPLYIAIGENDSYYGSGYAKKAYSALRAVYEKQGLSQNQIDEVLVLDVKGQSYFSERGASNQHRGGLLFVHDKKIMGWLFGK